MLKIKNQKGFAVIETALILVIVAIIGGTGYYVYHVNSKETKTLNTAQAADNATQPKSTTGKSQAQPQKYLTIKEWGVKLKLNSQSQDAYYVPTPKKPNSVYISSRKLDTFGAQHPECNAVNRSITLSRLKPGDDNVVGIGGPATVQDLEQEGTKAGDYFYVETTAQPCFGSQTGKVNKLGNQGEAIRVKLPTDKDVVLVR